MSEIRVDARRGGPAGDRESSERPRDSDRFKRRSKTSEIVSKGPKSSTIAVVPFFSVKRGIYEKVS